MFWKYNLTTASHIGTLLEKEDVALKELMDEEDILQECKAQKQKLIDFLVRPEILNEMIMLITSEPDEELDEKIRYKYPNIACEILTFDISPIHDAVTGDELLLDKLYSFLKLKNPLNPLLSSFFSKTMGKLLSRKTAVMFEYFRSKPDFIFLLLKHIETSAIMDLLSRLMTFTENIEMRAKIISWLSEQDVVNQLIALIDPAFNEDVNCNAAHVLCDTIRASREQMSLMQEKAEPDPLLEAVESPGSVQNLLDHMFNGEKKESVIVHGISVLLALLEFKKHSVGNPQQLVPPQNQSILQTESAPQTITSFFFRNEGPEQMTPLDVARLSEGINNVLAAVIPRLTDFYKLLIQPPSRSPIKLTFGLLDPPLGYSRLEDVHLLSSLIGTNNHAVNMELTRLKTMPVLMDLFFKYTWNNFLHTHVEHAVGRIFNNEPVVDDEGNKVHPLLDQFLLEYKITEKLLTSFQDDSENTVAVMQKKGYMGHLTKIANHIAQGAESGLNSALIQEKLKELPEEHLKEWKVFTDSKLAEINKKNSTPLVGGVPLPSSSDEALGFRSMAFSQDSSLPQVQQISSNYVDQFCFNEDFPEPEDNITGQLNRLASVHFRLTDDNWVQRNVELFEQVCREKNSHIPEICEEPDSDEDVWDEKEEKFSFRERKESGENSSDSDEDINVPSSRNESIVLNNDDLKMEVDSQDTDWSSNLESVPMDVTPVSAHVNLTSVAVQDPWGQEQASSASGDKDNWADFSNFAAFGSNSECSDGVSSSTNVAMKAYDSPLGVEFVSSSEVSSTSNNSSDVVSSVPVIKAIEQEGSAVLKKETLSASGRQNGPV